MVFYFNRYEINNFLILVHYMFSLFYYLLSKSVIVVLWEYSNEIDDPENCEKSSAFKLLQISEVLVLIRILQILNKEATGRE